MPIDNSWYSFLPSYVEGAASITSGKPLTDYNIDKLGAGVATRSRQEIKYLNVNGTDIPTIVKNITAMRIGVNINTQVETQNEKFNALAEKLIRDHNKRGVGELTGKHHFNSAVRQISSFEKLEGGILVRHHYSKKWKLRYKYEVVSVSMIDSSKNWNTTVMSKEMKESDYRDINGIRLNKYNQEIGYWIYNNDDKTSSSLVPSEDITYYSEQWVSIGQHIAISQLVSMLSTLDKSKQYEDSEIKAAAARARTGGYLKSHAYNQIVETVVANIKTTYMNDPKQMMAEFQKINEKLSALGIKPETLTVIPSTDEVQFDSRNNDSQYNDLTDRSENKMASSQGMSGIGLYAKAKQANYSAMKQTGGVDQRQADIDFDNLSHKVIREIQKRIIRVGVQLGILPDRKKYWSDEDAYLEFRYIRHNNIDIEPSKNAIANDKKLNNKTTTKGMIVEKETGIPYEEFCKKAISEEILEIKIREEMFKEAGLEAYINKDKENA